MFLVKAFGAIPHAGRCLAFSSCKQSSPLPVLAAKLFAIRVDSSFTKMPPRRAAKRAATEAGDASEEKIKGNGDVTKKSRGKRARKANKEVEHSEDESPVTNAKTEKVVKKKPVSVKSRKQNAEIEEHEVKTTEKAPSASVDYAKKGSWKIVSMNVNGIRSWLPKGGLEYIAKEDADVFCVQETKCSEDKLPPELTTIDGYESYFLAGDKEGYSGVGILTKKTPLNVSYGIGVEEHDSEGRVITLEFDKFFVVNSYVPNAGRGLVRLDYRLSWDKDFRKYLVGLKQKKGVILTGDLNVAHNEIDLKNPKTNRKNAGFTDEERQGLTDLLKEGFVDSFRKLYPETEGAYTFWTYMRNARANNVGWRLDYFIVSENLIDDVIDNEIRSEIMGSDHCPIVLHLK